MAKNIIIIFPLVFLVVYVFFSIAVSARQDSLVMACEKLNKNVVQHCLQFVTPFIGKAQVRNISDVGKLGFSETKAKLIAARDFTSKQIQTSKGLSEDQNAALRGCFEYQQAGLYFLDRAEREFEGIVEETDSTEARLEHKNAMDILTEEVAQSQGNCADVFQMGPDFPMTDGLNRVKQLAFESVGNAQSLQSLLTSVVFYLIP